MATTEPVMDRLNNYIHAAAALRFLGEGELDKAGSLVQYAFADRQANGEYKVDALGAMGLADLYTLGENSAVGKRIHIDADRFNSGLEDASVAQVTQSNVGKLGLGKAVLEKLVADGGSMIVKDLGDAVEEYKLRSAELGTKYKRQIKDEPDKDRKAELSKEYKAKQDELNETFKQEVRISGAIGEAVRLSTERVGTDTLIYGQYSGAKSAKEVMELVEKSPPAHKASELY